MHPSARSAFGRLYRLRLTVLALLALAFAAAAAQQQARAVSQFERDTASSAAEVLERRDCLRSFWLFCQKAWPYVEPRKMVMPSWKPGAADGGYMRAIADHLQAIYEGRLSKQNLLLNIAPRHGKSTIVSVLFPAWIFAQDPTYKMLFGSYAMGLARRDSRQTRKLITSAWYQRLFVRGKWSIAHGEDRDDDFATTLGGRRQCIAVGSQAIGYGGQLILVDDPMNVKEAYSVADRTRAVQWYCDTLTSRHDDAATGIMVIVGQRLHEQDVCGWILENEREDYEWLCLPEEYEPGRPCLTHLRPANDNAVGPANDVGPVFWQDPRTRAGELLFPERFPAWVLDRIKRKLGSKYAAQYLQHPLDPNASLFKRADWRWWRPKRDYIDGSGSRRPVGCDELAAAADLPERATWAISVDCTFKDLETSDYVVMQVWAAYGADRFLVDLRRGQWSFFETCRQLELLADRWPKAKAKWIEDAANGPAVISQLQRRVSGLIAVPVGKAGKVARAQACSPEVQSGNVFLPEYAPFLETFVSECEGFPKVKHDDQVDAMSQALNQLSGRSLRRARALVSR
jgi:predicted phage terminase large subunit-like protein